MVQGHVYERRSDLSPDGKYLLYFAGKHRGRDWTWTAISKILTYAGTVVNVDKKAAVRWQLEPPRTWEKLHPLAPERYSLRMCLSGVGERQGRRYRMEHFVGDTHDVGRSDWADWAPNGDLLFARGFSLFRVPFAGGQLAPLEDAREIIDLANEKFVERRL